MVTYALIDPPSPFDGLAAWEAFLEEMHSASPDLHMRDFYITDAEEMIRQIRAWDAEDAAEAQKTAQEGTVSLKASIPTSAA